MKINYLQSPNCDDRPSNTEIDLIVVHNISLPPGEFAGDFVTDFFLNKLDPTKHEYFKEIIDLKVSSHCYVRRDGNIFQYVPFEKRAWHAGRSCFQGKESCNDFSIGIELEGTDDQSFTDQQYNVLAELIATLQQQYPGITNDRIVGHSDIASGRKTDPGPMFSWDKLLKKLFFYQEKFLRGS